MKRRNLIFIPLLALLLGGCKSNVAPSSEEVIAPTGITITGPGSLAEEESAFFTATVRPEGAPQTVTWSTSDEEKATVTQTGEVTGVSEGNVFIIATSTVNEAVTAQVPLIITEKVIVAPDPTEIIITSAGDATTVTVDTTLKLNAVVLPAEASQEVNWSTSDENKATVDNTGLVRGVAAGMVDITATSVAKDTITKTFTLEVVEGEQTQDWENMEYSSHSDFVATGTEDGTPFKVKGVVTYAAPVSASNTIDYFIQSGTEGYYIYKQDAERFPVVEGQSYTVGGFFKNYNGTRELIDIEYFVPYTPELTYEIVDISGMNVLSILDMAPHQASFVKLLGTTISVLPTNWTKAYNVKVNVSDQEFTLRVDPVLMTAEEFAAITAIFQDTAVGTPLDVVGIMCAFGWGAVENQMKIVRSTDIEAAAMGDKQATDAAAASLEMLETVPLSVTNIELPTNLVGYEGLTIEWTATGDIINTSTGAVTHPLTTSDLTLTATCKKGTAQTVRSWLLTVFGTNTDALTTVHTLDLEDADPNSTYGISPTKSKYDVPETNNMVSLGNPVAEWQLKNTLIGGASNDRFTGIYAMRTQSNNDPTRTGRIELQDNTFDFNMIEFDAAIFSSDPKGGVLTFEVSTDDGATWVALEREYTINHFELATYRVRTGTTGNVRVAIILKSGTGKRMNIDNVKLIKEV